MISLNYDWEFVTEWSDEFALGKGLAETVRLPHTVREIPQAVQRLELVGDRMM